jgi:hypothetical protein
MKHNALALMEVEILLRWVLAEKIENGQQEIAPKKTYEKNSILLFTNDGFCLL